MSAKYEKLRILLRELFQLDQPDLDFGLYRVMHAKAGEVSQFLDEDLLPQVKQAFRQYQTADEAELEKELAKEVYDHLYRFFRRYYSDGDFLAKRVYKPGVYAIPYEGEEVKLHWANRDQYYIKTSEYLRDYAFRLRPDSDSNPMRVHFRLVDAAEGEHGNVQAAAGNDRAFILAAPGTSGHEFMAEEDGEQGPELSIRFEYRPATLTDWPADARLRKTKPPARKELVALAEKRVRAVSSPAFASWVAELSEPHVKADGERADYTRLVAHLNRYTARNTFDYFIHKDLGAFLRRELDFYVKNEVMHLDDIENETAPRVEQYLSKIRVLRRIAGKIIDFLAQLENFQKKLWQKKKLVVETQYYIMLGSIPQEFYPEIAANDAQREEWVQLFALDEFQGDLRHGGFTAPLTTSFLQAHPTLGVDTRHFPAAFTTKLIGVIENLDEQLGGVLMNAENYHGLEVLARRYNSGCDVIYIDPPYNTDASAINYKNDYKHSSWMSLIENRLAISSRLLAHAGVLCMAIDDEEVAEARHLLARMFVKEIGVAAVRSNPQSRKSRGTLSPSHEYALFFGKSAESMPGSLELTEKRMARYPKQDEQGRFSWMSFIRTGTNDTRLDRPKLYYPIFVANDDTFRVPQMTWSSEAGEQGEYLLLEGPKENEIAVFPIVASNHGLIEKRWHRGHERVSREPEEYRVRRDSQGAVSIDFKTRIDEESTPVTWWDRSEYASANYGAGELKKLFGSKPFDFPKALQLVADCLRAANVASDSVVLDFFAGSGTTGHAVINLNREDGGQRKFILVEMNAYFQTVLLPRIKKVIFTPEWKDGKPERLATAEETERSPRIVKIIRLESYEDALNNLETRRPAVQRSLLDTAAAQGAGKLREQFILRYLLDVETRGSQSLLNVQAFTDPTAYKLKVKQPGSDESREVNVDLLETFNWLIGLTVRHIATPQTFSAEFKRDSAQRLRLKRRLEADDAGPYWFRPVTGTTPDGRQTLIIWRKRPGGELPDGIEQDNLVLDEWFARQGYSSKDSEFDLIYVNGSNNLANLKSPDDTWKVRLIEEDFHRLMFETEGE